jgi:hypothetical protein
LEKFYININLFDEIIKVGIKDKKSDYIKTGTKSIFIDDSYTERLDVLNINKIHVFTCDMIECLFDEKL